MNKTAQRLKGAIGAYFAACDATRERLPLKNGGFSERQIPYTLFGLARAVHMTPEEILKAIKSPRQSQKGALLRDAVLNVASYTLERALLGELTYQVALEVIRPLGLSEQAQDANQTLRVVMDGQLERYAQ